MSIEALTLEACRMCGIVDWFDFFRLPTVVQDRWLAHAMNMFTGAYLRRPAPTTDRGSFTERAIAAAKARGVL